MHLPFNDARYSPNASSNVNYFFAADVKCGLYEIKTTDRDRSKKNSETELKQRWTGEIQDQDVY